MNKTKKFKKAMAIVTAVAVTFVPLAMNVPYAEAAGVAVTVSSPAGGEFAASTSTDVTFGYTTSSTEYASGDVINIKVAPALAGALSDCTSATVDADGDSTSDGAFGSFTTSGAVYTFTAATTDAATGTQGGNGNGVDLCLNFAASTTQGSYSISFVDDNDEDNGAALVYVGDDNDVTVTADVSPTLSFNIRTADDTADTNVCAIGTVTTSTLPVSDGNGTDPGECAYGLAIGTNSNSGFQAQINADAALNTAAHNMVDITEDAAWSAGSEAYGLGYVDPADTGSDGAGTFDQELTGDGDFGKDTTPVPTSATNFVSYTDGVEYVAGTDATDLTVVEHGLTVSAGTPAGFYDQVVTYTVTAGF